MRPCWMRHGDERTKLNGTPNTLERGALVYIRRSNSFVLRDDKIRLVQIIARMNEQQFYREAGAERRRITINRISAVVHPSPRPVVRLSGSATSTARFAAAAAAAARRRPSIPHRPFSALTSRLPADKNHRRIGPCRKDAKPVIDTVIIEYLYRAPIFVHYGHAGPALSARCRRSHRARWGRRWTDGTFLIARAATCTVGLFDCS